MAFIKEVRGIAPKFPKSCWFADNATIVGEVEMGENCTVWFNAVIRGDVHYIKIGSDTNIQDNAVVHCTYKTAPTVIGNKVSIGHSAIIHGCELKDRVLIGMGAIVMDHAIIEKGAIIGAGSVVLEGTYVESNSIWAGVPAKRIKKTEGKNNEMIDRIASNYPMYANWFKS
ncbi:MAG TPA: gamma carbonic anhydrase family protein [Cyclobacteriaceae bacterium]